MARHETGFSAQDDSGEAPQPGPSSIYQGFPASAVADKPGQERQYTLDRIERTIGSIM